jgi:hypothetical protein
MPEMNCKTFIHRFDSDRRLHFFQQLRDSTPSLQKVTVVKMMANARTLCQGKVYLGECYVFVVKKLLLHPLRFSIFLILPLQLPF